MSNLSKRIYRKIIGLFPNLKTIEPYNKVDLPGFDNVHLVVLDRLEGSIDFILTRHKNENGQLIADPSIQIVVDPDRQTARPIVYKDLNYFHDVVPRPTEIGTMGVGQANRYLYDFLKELKGR